jgi:DNA-binding response OmpR family regulator
LLIEADRTARADLREALDRAGFQVTLADTGTAGLESVHENRPDLVVLDLDLPDENGWEVCRQLLEADRTPLILLNSPAEATDCILGLELGADDYVAKPFHPREIAARAKSVLRRWTGRPLARRPGPRQYPGLLLDPQRYEVKVEGQSVHLTPLEFDLLWHISAVPGQVVSREELLRVVWNGRSAERNLRTVDAYIRRLRLKLKTGTASTWRIRTIYGQGYRFEVRG